MKRARTAVPIALKKSLHHNPQSGYYEITFEDTTYHLTMAQMVLLKKYFHNHSNENVTPNDWYNALTRDERKEVLRTNMNSNTEYFNDGLHLE